MSPGALSPAERRWLTRLRFVLRDQPARLLLVESGDALFVVDRDAAAGADLHDGAARRAGLVLADVPEGTGRITGVSG